MSTKCIKCKKPFKKVKPNQRTCGKKCRLKRRIEIEKERHRNRVRPNIKNYNLCAL